MGRTPNPFSPSFGVTPPVLGGRDDIIDAFAEGLADGPGAPERAVLLEGQRGTGKTVLLNELEATAAEQGWLVISDEAGPGFLDRITQTHLPALLAEWDPRGPQRRITGGGITGVGQIASQVTERHAPHPSMRTQLAQLTDLLAERNTEADVPVGVLITLDELQSASVDEMGEFGAQWQLLRREGRELAFACAGVTTDIDTLIASRRVTFLQRASRHHLGDLSPVETAYALETPIREAGGTISPEALEIAVAGTHGYPYLIQAVGYSAWSAAKGHPIETTHAEYAVRWAEERLGTQVHEPALRSVSPRERQFLLAMAVDDGPSRMSDLRERLRTSAPAASNLSRALKDRGIVGGATGQVDFLLPRMRQHLRAHHGEEVSALESSATVQIANPELPRVAPSRTPRELPSRASGPAAARGRTPRRHR